MKALHKAAIIMKIALRFRKAFFGAKFANKAEPATLNRATGVVLVVLGGGGAFAYIKFIRPKQASKVSADPDDYDFADEEEYINEDEPEQEEETEDTK